MQALILAAGKGERLRPLTETAPKVMLPLANKPILEHNLEKLGGLVDEIILVVGYREDDIRAHFGKSFRGMGIRYVAQKRQLGTGHAVKQAEGLLKDRFLLLMGDNLYSRDDIRSCLRHELSVLVKEVDNPSIFGVCRVEKGFLRDIIEKPKNPPSRLANAGLYVLEKEIFGHSMPKTSRDEYEIVDALREMCGNRKISAVEATEFEHITYPWDMLKANEAILKKTGPLIDKGARISKDAEIQGPVAIGPGARLNKCVVRPYASIGAVAVIGNFVEVKNSIIMENTKIPHLSYVGDSVIGPGCNFGAGTKIANLRFDDGTVKAKVNGKMVDSGTRKLGCIMGEGAKTGINVSILPGAVIGAGSRIYPGKVVR
jgi:UDP-N-acetylglucosamine diphosphorylase/glucosamine-1-phosphate N-acetyltransferase